MTDQEARNEVVPAESGLAPAKTVLFLDDEDAILTGLRKLFCREGYITHFFSSPGDALAYLAQNPVDIIVSDMRMPGMNGVEFMNRAASICPEAVRIMLSGYEDKSIVVNALAKELAQYYILKPWNDEGLKDLIGRAIQHQEEMRKSQLNRLLDSFTTLPSRPVFHTRLRAMLSKDNNPLTAIIMEVEKIPPLVAKLLKVANSVYYSTRKPVTTVREAVMFIGTEYIVSLVTAIEAFQSVCKGTDAKSTREIEGMWAQALRRAAIAKLIGEHWDAIEDPHLAYVVSLLQDIGMVIRLCSEPEKYQRFLQVAATQKISRYEADVRIFSTPHDELGASLLEFWNFPPEIVNAVLKHHRFAGDDALVKAVQIAEALCCFDPLNPHDPAIDRLLPEWRETLRAELSLL